AGIPFARNRGVREARGAWVCFFDDDQTAEPDWVRQLYRRATARGVDCVGGARDLVIEGGAAAPESELGRRLLGEVLPDANPGEYHPRWLPNTGNVLIRRSVFDEIGGFDEGALEGGDDTDFFHRLLKSGRRAVFAPSSMVHHHIPAARVSEDYLQWVAMRHGLVMARRDLTAGGLYTAFSLVARGGQAALVLFPHWAWLRLTGRKARALGPLCQMRRAQGFAKFLLYRLAPKPLRGERALGVFHHRNSAAAAARATNTTAADTGVTP
ncbi:MAG: glycosyltransferase, partial [Planctomycetota bacterium]